MGGRVMTLVWSEFGRRALQNDSNGTDHGAAGVGFLMGTRVADKMVGEFRGLQRGLDQDGNLKATVDFRAVYASLVEQWFDVDAARIVPGRSQDEADEARRMSTRLLILVAATRGRRSRSPRSPARARRRRPSSRSPRRSGRSPSPATNVKAGKVFVEVVNFGTDAHDLVVLRQKKGAKPSTFHAIDPNARSEKALTPRGGAVRALVLAAWAQASVG